MKKFAVILATGAALALSACGSSDDASEEAVADNVEMPANDAMEPVTAMPVEDAGLPAADEDAAIVTETDDQIEAEAVGESAADVAARAQAAADDAGTAVDNAEDAMQ